MEDYKKLATMFVELVIIGKDLEEENEKYKVALREQFDPYDVDKEQKIKTLSMQLEHATLREDHLKEMLIEKDGEINSLSQQLTDLQQKVDRMIKGNEKLEEILSLKLD